MGYFFFFKQKTAYEMRISDWSSDVCSSDLDCYSTAKGARKRTADIGVALETVEATVGDIASSFERFRRLRSDEVDRAAGRVLPEQRRSEEHTSELQSLMRISYAVFCLKKKKTHT